MKFFFYTTLNNTFSAYICLYFDNDNMHICCDRGAQFTSALWRDLAQFFGAQLRHSTAYHQQAQGMIERVNRALKMALKCAEAPTEWHNNLP